MPGFRSATVACVFDGQSLNLTPTPGVDTYPIRLMNDLGLQGPIDVWIGGTGWFTLLTTMPVRVAQYANAGLTTVYLMNGGSTDIQTSHTAAEIYADEVSCANAARSYGFDYVIGGTTTPYSGWAEGSASEIKRDALNALVLADAEGAFDAVCDFSGTPGLHDPTNPLYYPDGLHFTSLAAQTAADAMVATLATVPVLNDMLGLS